MPYPRPTLTQLRAQAQADIGSTSLLPVSNTRIIADVQAKGFNGNYGYLDYIAKQSNPFTATDEYLEAWAALKKVFRKAPQASTGSVTFQGTAGKTVSEGLAATRGDGVGFVTTSSAEIDANGQATVTVQATTTGAVGNSDLGAAITLNVAIPGGTATGAASLLSGGADLETDDELRSRMLDAYAAPPQGGNANDYVEWAEQVPGVTRAWVLPSGEGPGTVVIYFMMDEAEAAHGGFPQGTNGVATREVRGTPATGDQLAVANLVAPLAPVTTVVYAFAPGQNVIEISIAGLTNASDSVKSAIAAAITQAFLTQGSPGGVIQASGAPTPGVVPLSFIDAAITSVAGSQGFVLQAISASNGAASLTSNIVSNGGFLPVLGTVTWL